MKNSVSTPVLSGFLEGLAKFSAIGQIVNMLGFLLGAHSASVIYCSLFLFEQPFRNIKTTQLKGQTGQSGQQVSLLIHFRRSQAQIRMGRGRVKPEVSTCVCPHHFLRGPPQDWTIIGLRFWRQGQPDSISWTGPGYDLGPRSLLGLGGFRALKTITSSTTQIHISPERGNWQGLGVG